METLGRVLRPKSHVAACLSLFTAFALASIAPRSTAQDAAGPQPRIVQAIDSSQRATIRGSHSPRARTELDAGRVSSETKLEGMSVTFQRTDAQEADLQSLIAAQQNPASPFYHKWLTPEQFGARFGVSDVDISKVKLWLEQQGFAVDAVARAKNRITFSGNAAQAETAFGAELHYYTVNGDKKFAPSTDLTLPGALASVVESVSNLSSFRPRPRVKNRGPVRAPKANFTSSQTGNHFLTPGDVAIIYDVKPAYTAGLMGTGQSIAVVGQSAIAVADIENFQAAAGLAKKDPTQILVPSSGTSATSTGDESESDLDLEYAGGIAPGATLIFVYTGNSPNMNVFNSIQYAIDNNTAPIISTSYGDCETDFAASDYQMLEGIFKQGATQGQTIIGPSGDAGSTDCQGVNLTTAQQQALAVDYPASSAYVTGMGGSEFPAADVASTNTTFWASASGSDIVASALSYIPEQVWNDDDSTNGLSSGGGGISALTPRPTWQTGVPGIPTGTFRLVPDISLTASPNNAGFLYCSSDTTQTGVTGSCANGFRDTAGTNLTVAGGTSFDVPMFAGMVAIINQKLNSSGQGVVNPTLYMLAANATTYASAFHDITAGSNACLSGPTFCSTAGAASYSAGVGYDLASGLGSIDFDKLLNAWPGSSGGGTTSGSFTLSATNVTVAAGSSGASTVTITPENGYAGTIAWTLASNPTFTNGCLTLANTTVSGTAATAATLSVTTGGACASGALASGSGKQKSSLLIAPYSRFNGPASFSTSGSAAAGIAVALVSIAIVALLGMRSRRLVAVVGVFALAAVAFVMMGCGGGSGNSSSSGSGTANTAKGTYSVTITGTDTVTSAMTASTTITVTVD